MRRDCGRGNRYSVLSWPDLPQNLSESNTIAIFLLGKKNEPSDFLSRFFYPLEIYTTDIVLHYNLSAFLMLPASLFSGRIPETSVCELKLINYTYNEIAIYQRKKIQNML